MPLTPVHRPATVALPRHPRAQAGFSLLELIAVMVLIAIAVTVASLSVTRSLGSAKIHAVSRDLVAALRHTRGQAIVKGEQKTLDVDLEAMSYTAPGKEAVKFPDKVEIKLHTAQNELIAARAGRIRFYPDGSSTGGHISVISGEREWRVNVGWLTGEVSMEELRSR
ncbi:GspH/FimT family pseudopilin [Tahibacter amnicola]|uniref:Type II secretion system protein H n=1 Tax=Tahibacter amnicola TaxID=2976241 RepID=A0ABY6BCL9_9GAMM|nr:GspH/FimT family pseudopilin [Tahibacter amnicola]UXI67789.1 prepilin-type N-terminal cleavage/methylation domain-containing protein [Tahibacter amnicola]